MLKHLEEKAEPGERRLAQPLKRWLSLLKEGESGHHLPWNILGFSGRKKIYFFGPPPQKH
jgi:hypothetical protein